MKNLITFIALVTLSLQVIAQSTLQPNVLKLTIDTTDDETALVWTTQNEQNSAFFRIEKSEDGITFQPIVVINAKQGNVKTHTYTYVTTDTVAATYRVVLVTMEGITTVSNTLPVNLMGVDAQKGLAVNSRK